MDESTDSMDRLRAILSDRSRKTSGDGGRRWTPLGDLRKTKGEYTLFLDLPGIDEDELEICFRNGRLIVAGQREFDHDKEDAEEYTRLDRPYGWFSYEIPLDGDVVADQMIAKYRRGVLKVQVPRTNTSIP